MVYRYGQKVQRGKRSIKKYVIGVGASVVMVAGFAVPALASSAGDGSAYGTQPGFDTATMNTPCAGHGAFGAFGKDFNFGNSTSGRATDSSGNSLAGNAQNSNGADGQATATNNSTLCGNPQTR